MCFIKSSTFVSIQSIRDQLAWLTRNSTQNGPWDVLSGGISSLYSVVELYRSVVVSKYHCIEVLDFRSTMVS